MPIEILIDKLDTSELVRDQLAALLKSESVAQQALATAADKDPRAWNLRVFVERTNPWAEWLDGPSEELDAPPIVNVSFETATPDPSTSDRVMRQKVSGVFNIDCYAYGLSRDVPGGGHLAGDMRAATEAMRAARLVRNILMTDSYTYLGMRGLVWGRWVQSITAFAPEFDGRAAQNIAGCRVVLQADYNEFSPQVEPTAVVGITVGVLRDETGEVYFNAQYGEPNDS